MLRSSGWGQNPSLLGPAPAPSPCQPTLLSSAGSGKATSPQAPRSRNLAALALFPPYLAQPEAHRGLPSLGRAAQLCGAALENPLLERRFAKASFLCFETAQKVIFRPFLCLSSAQPPVAVHSVVQAFCRYQRSNSANLGMMR